MRCGEVCIGENLGHVLLMVRLGESRSNVATSHIVDAQSVSQHSSHAFLAVQVLLTCMKMVYITWNCLPPAIFLAAVSSTVLVKQFSCGTKFNIIRLLNTLLVLVTQTAFAVVTQFLLA